MAKIKKRIVPTAWVSAVWFVATPRRGNAPDLVKAHGERFFYSPEEAEAYGKGLRLPVDVFEAIVVIPIAQPVR